TLKAIRPDLLHTVATKAVLYGGVAARLNRQRAVVSAISGLGHLFVENSAKTIILRVAALYLYRFALRHPRSRVIFQNLDDLDLFVERKIIPRSDSLLLRGVSDDFKLFSAFPLPMRDALVVLPARMLREKGVFEFVEAAKKLRA